MPYEIPAAANTPYRPSNGTEGEMFMEKFCRRCQLGDPVETNGDGCDILLNTMIFDLGDDGYPEEWTHDFAGRPQCTAFLERIGGE